MNKDKILKNIDSLSNNAMFNISLTSKELFHTNFWTWLLRKYPNIFACAFDLEHETNCKFEISREKNHFDLCIETKDEIIIIENKLKSFPNKKQLEEYAKYETNKKKKLILISYFKPLNLKTICQWKYLSYKDLYNRIKKCFVSAKDSDFYNNDKIIIQDYIEFLRLLVEFQDNIEIFQADKISDIWDFTKDFELQKKMNKINFAKTFERVVNAKITELVLDKFEFTNDIDEIRIDCGRDLKVFSDILFYFPNAWSEDETKRQDLSFLGISLWEKYYRYYAGLHKKQCGINDIKKGRYDKENKDLGFKYLSDNYAWLFNQENTCKWNGYSNNDEMYLYKKLDISELSVKDLVEKVVLDLELIYFYVKALEETNV